MVMDTFELTFVVFKRLLSCFKLAGNVNEYDHSCFFTKGNHRNKNLKIELISKSVILQLKKLHDKVKNLPSPPAVISVLRGNHY